MGSEGRPYRTEVFDGFEILVGKGDERNDTLTFGVGTPRDFWLHVSGVPGSHVVVRNPENLDALPRPVLEAAASLAAWHSKARGARGKGEVHVCRVADVSKPRGCAPGEVRLRRWDAVRVYPRNPVDAPDGNGDHKDTKSTKNGKR
jgi:predicted ribosome quality control (RQC) complex YloA/Tae2 family protein